MSSSIAPPAAEYGADEISAIVLDPGYSTTRAGFAGEDTPKSVVPSYYGITNPDDPNARRLFDDNVIHTPLPNLDIRNPMSTDGLVEDWDTASKLWEYAITSRLTGKRDKGSIRDAALKDEQDGDIQMEDMEKNEKPLAHTPLLMTEPGWNTTKNREKAIELAFEDWDALAFWMGRSGVLSSFASGRPSALVIDLGASTTSVTAVHDGMILKKGTMKSTLAGNWISDQTRLLFSQSQPPVALIPHYMVSSKTAVDAGAPAQAVYRSFATLPKESFRRLQEERTLTEFKESCVQIWNPARNNNASLQSSMEYIKSQEPGRPFEMPDGWNNVFGLDRYRVAEGLFDHTCSAGDSSVSRAQTIPGLAQAALAGVDVDIRPHLLANVVISGGSSLIQGLTDRVNYELQSLYPGPRVRLQAAGNVVERKYASWIGGSILASLGTFHQMWISKKEYEEHGANIIEKRCK